jgi:hypothetical protein
MFELRCFVDPVSSVEHSVDTILQRYSKNIPFFVAERVWLKVACFAVSKKEVDAGACVSVIVLVTWVFKLSLDSS